MSEDTKDRLSRDNSKVSSQMAKREEARRSGQGAEVQKIDKELANEGVHVTREGKEGVKWVRREKINVKGGRVNG